MKKLNFMGIVCPMLERGPTKPTTICYPYQGITNSKVLEGNLFCASEEGPCQTIDHIMLDY
jgi:hypothetical protein